MICNVPVCDSDIDEPIVIVPTSNTVGKEYVGTSQTDKPTGVQQYSIYHELDTGKNYYYDNGQWNEIPCCSGGGGGGGADGVKTAKVTFIVNAGTGGAGLDGGVQDLQEGFVFLTYDGVKTKAGANAGNTVELTAILTEVEGIYEAQYIVIGSNPIVTGDCELCEPDPVISVIITGDCTITVDPVE